MDLRADATWNAAHNGVKEFTVSASDLTEDAKLTCTLTGTSPDYGTVYVDEDMNLIHAPAEADANDTLHLENGILSVETPVNEYELNGNVLSIVRHRLNGSVTAEAWVYTAAPEKLVEFKYDSNGLRTQKKVTDHGQVVTSDYIYHGQKLVGLTCGNDTLHFFYDAQGRLVKADYNDMAYTYVHNLQGDVVGLLDSSGALVIVYKYNAWGKPMKVRSLTAAYGALAKRNPFRYRGYTLDEEAGLYYLQTRYSNANIGRFINADICLGTGMKFRMHHLFCYCMNDPISGADYTGQSFLNTVLLAAFAINSTKAAMNMVLESMSKTRIVDRTLVSNGKVYNIYNPLNHPGATIGPVPETIAYGEAKKSYFSREMLGWNLGTYEMSATGLLNPFKDSMVTISVSITVSQTGSLEPEAYIVAKFYRNYTDMELGVNPINKVAESDPILITGAGEDGYWFKPFGREEVYVTDNDGWLTSLIESIELE